MQPLERLQVKLLLLVSGPGDYSYLCGFQVTLVERAAAHRVEPVVRAPNMDTLCEHLYIIA